MNIAIDATLFTGKNNHTGIPNSVNEIIKNWIRNDKENEYYFFSCMPIFLDYDLPDNWHIVIDPPAIKRGLIWKLYKLPKDLKKYNIDVLWGPIFYLPRRVKGIKYVTTVYDIALFLFKNIGDPAAEKRMKINMWLACHRADEIIAISEATANDISTVFNIPKSKIAISYCGGLPSGYDIKNTTSVDNDLLKFDEKYFLFISTIEPRKNIITLVKAFEKFVDENGKDYKLVLAGAKGWRSEDIYAAVDNCKYKDLIIMPGFISANDKAYLLSHASAFVYPSLYEGFGIPVLEAFAYDLPVITTRISSLPEVADDAAFYIDEALDSNALSLQMKNAISLSNNEKEVLIQKMQKRLNKFSWDKNAKETFDILTR